MIVIVIVIVIVTMIVPLFTVRHKRAALDWFWIKPRLADGCQGKWVCFFGCINPKRSSSQLKAQ